MSDISLSKAVRSNLLSLQNTADMMATTQNRLATGNKVNSALDNPTNFFTASSLNSRAGDINQLMDGMANAIQTIEAADNGLTSITKTLESMQSTLRQARQDKSFETASFSVSVSDDALADKPTLEISGGQFGDSARSLDLTKTEYRASVTGGTYTAAADNAVTINGKTVDLANADIDAAIEKINDAGAGVTASKDGDTLVLTANSVDGNILIEDQTGTTGLVNETYSKKAATVTADDAAPFASPPSDTSLTINGSKIDIAAESTIDEVVDAINKAGLGITADIDDSGTNEAIRLTANDTNTAIEIGSAALGFAAESTGPSVVNSTGTPTSSTASSKDVARSVNDLVSEINSSSAFEGKIRASNDNGKLRIENLSTQELNVKGVSSTGNIDGKSTSISNIGGNTVREDLAAQYNELRDQLDKLADDASFNGINLLRGDNLKITFNETGTSELDIQSKNGESINSSTLGIETFMEASDLDSDESIDAMLGDIKTAINSVRSQSSAFGSSLSIVENRQDFSKNMINTLETGAGNLTLADSNQEAANLLALQTRQQLSSTALSMASQQDQSVLSLF